ncbi:MULTISPECIES: helix-turn-helix domain-containing protein [unclassified Paraburkholderia]|uniref:helix-turn-helix domain-containing protein n=1 Tax=unclassified Paraburkholderia TaxID=2615204 RepID=UPI001612774B|nr:MULTISPECIES: helix-turn-helix transcriptional regulator [unclassified Paraburkholderia]MBB5441433.1 transcriptional regulator with XRE-family HTH domain [Paraburkholderia sp. WSM4177]MBB5481828.1 transcriptional regulator with XRE-family HTH domain [Paraburkholderia sp. WSM4180]
MSATGNTVFGGRLKEARLRAGLSQKSLGIAAGLDPSVASTRINRYELGIHKVDYPFACQLATELSVPTAYFFTEDDDLAELILLYGQASKRTRSRLLAAAREI